MTTQEQERRELFEAACAAMGGIIAEGETLNMRDIIVASIAHGRALVAELDKGGGDALASVVETMDNLPDAPTPDVKLPEVNAGGNYVFPDESVVRTSWEIPGMWCAESPGEILLKDEHGVRRFPTPQLAAVALAYKGQGPASMTSAADIAAAAKGEAGTVGSFPQYHQAKRLEDAKRDPLSNVKYPDGSSVGQSLTVDGEWCAYKDTTIAHTRHPSRQAAMDALTEAGKGPACLEAAAKKILDLGKSLPASEPPKEPGYYWLKLPDTDKGNPGWQPVEVTESQYVCWINSGRNETLVNGPGYFAKAYPDAQWGPRIERNAPAENTSALRRACEMAADYLGWNRPAFEQKYSIDRATFDINKTLRAALAASPATEPTTATYADALRDCEYLAREVAHLQSNPSLASVCNYVAEKIHGYRKDASPTTPGELAAELERMTGFRHSLSHCFASEIRRLRARRPEWTSDTIQKICDEITETAMQSCGDGVEDMSLEAYHISPKELQNAIYGAVESYLIDHCLPIVVPALPKEGT